MIKNKSGRITILLGLVGLLLALSLTATSNAQTSWQWYKLDTHVHSAVSADGFVDLGLISLDAQTHGYDGLFLSDHNGASSFHINFLTANHMAFEDSYTRWDIGNFGTLTATANELVTSPVNSGTNSLHLKSSTDESGETYIWTKRGPNFRSGDIILNVSVYPTQIDPGSGVYVSVAIGGDPTVVKNNYGYTTENGVVSPGKSTVLVWQLGSARAASSDPNARVLTYPLSYTLNAWNHYSLNVSQALLDIPFADRPLDYNGLTHLKLTAAANNGTAEAYFDTYTIDASAPVDPADEYVYRTNIVDDFDTPTFRIFPSYEMGQQRHSNRFNFGITDPVDYRSYASGTDGILETQLTGYPVQVNHPGVTITQDEVVQTQGTGADFIEVRDQSWRDTWDAVLQQGVVILGQWSSDSHSASFNSKYATFAYAPALDFDALLQALYEGRSYASRDELPLIFNLDDTSQAPYPARYPVFISDAATAADVHILIPDGVTTSDTVKWMLNGSPTVFENPSGNSYEATKSISLAGPFTYIRTEVQSSSGSIDALSQPIFFIDVPSLPTGMSFHVDGITTPNGRDYTRIAIKGITNSSWSSTSQVLWLTLENPTGSLADLRMVTDTAPQQLKVDGVIIPETTSLTTFQNATNSIWYYDSAAQMSYLKVVHASNTASVLVEFSTSGDIQSPTVPTNETATPIHLAQVDVTWAAATDDTGVAGYTIYRDGTIVAAVDGSTLSYSDTTVAAGTTYSYTVDAFDASDNHSARSDPAIAATPLTGTFTFTAVADTYVDALNPTANYGSSSAVRTDASPARRAYLRFDVQGLIGSVVGARLRVYAESGNAVGYSAHNVPDTIWDESTVTYNTAPAYDAAVGSSGAFGAGVWTEVDVTSLVSGDGLVSFAMTSTSSTNTRYSSLSAATGNAAELVIETASASNAPPTVTLMSPVASAVVSGTVNVTASASDDIGVSQVEFFVDGVSIGVDATAPYEAAWDTTTTSNGSHTVSATATDTTIQNSSDGVAVMVDNLPPTGPVTFTVVSDTYVDALNPTANYGSSSAVRTDASPARRAYLRFDVQGLIGSVVDARLRVYAENGNAVGYSVHNVPDTSWDESTMTYDTAPAYDAAVGSSGAFGSGVWTEVDVTSLVSGNGLVSFAMTSTSNTNTRYSSLSAATGNPAELVIETASASNAPPTVTLTSPVASAVVSGTVNVAASASDDNGVSQVEFFVDGVSVGVDATAPYEAAWDTTTVADGSLTVSATATDTTSQISSDSVFVTVDNTLPTVSLTTPTNGATVSGAITVTSSASDANGVSQVEFFVDGVSIGVDATAPYEAAWDTATSSDGSVTVSATATDTTSQSSSDSVVVTVDNTAPTVTLTSPAAGAAVSGIVNVTASASDANGVSQVEFFVGGVSIGVDTTAPYEASWDSATSSDGSVTVSATATDTASQSSSDSVAVTVDNTLPSVSLTSPTNSAAVAGIITVTASASDANGVSQVEFFVDGVSIGVDTTAPYEAAWDTDTSIDGSVTVSATATDITSQSSGDSIVVTVDNALPTVSLISPTNGATVSGAITVTASASDANGVSQVEFFVDGVSIGVDTTAPYEAAWDSTTSADGSVTVSSTVTDTANQTANDSISVTVDNTPPTVSLTSPTNGATVSGAITVTASASDANGVSQVEFFVDGVSIGVDVTAPYEAAWDTTTASDGSHTVSATATDTTSQTANDSISVTVDNTAPTVSVTSPTNSAMVSGAITVTANASDANGVSQVEFFVDGVSIGVDTTVPYEAAWDTTTSADGSVTVSATATDPPSQTANDSVTVTVDNIPPDNRPTVSLTNPANGVTVLGTITVTVSASDDNGVSQVEFFVDGVSIGVDASDPYEAAWDTATSSDGSATVSATVTDTASQSSSDSVVATVDNTPPTVSLTSPANGATVSGTITVTANASDDNGVSQVEFFVDGVSIGVDATAPYEAAWDTTTAPDGSHTVSATATDTTSQTANDSISVTVDNTAATVTLTSPVASAVLSGTVNVTADASDANGVSQVEFFVDGVSIGVDTLAPYEAAWDTTTATDGSVTVSATATDTTSQTANDSISVTVDNTPPTVSLTSPTNGATVLGTITVTASASDANGVSQVEFFVDGVSIGVDISAPYEAAWDTTTSADGSVTVSVTVTDTASQSSSDSVVVTVDNTPPTVSLTSPTNGATVLGTITVTASASDANGVSQVEFFVDGVSIGVDISAPYEAAWDTTTVADGSVTVSATATDPASQTANDSIAVTVDNVPPDNPPTVSLTNPANAVTVSGAITVTASASDANGVSQVEFFVDGVSIGVDATAPYEAAWDTTTVADGSVTVSATATDTASQSSSDSVAVTVDNTVPTVSLTSPTNGATVSGAITVTANASDANGVSQVEFFVDGVSIGVDISAPYEATWDTTTASDGSHTVSATVTDTASQSSSDSVVVTVDNTPPSAPGSLTATDVQHNQVTLGWTASTDDVGVVGYDVYRDGGLLASTGVVTTYQDSTVLAETSYQYHVIARDAAGNASASSNLANVTTPAAPDVTPPSAPASLTATDVGHDQVTLGWAVSTDDVGVVGYDVYRDGSLLASTGVLTTYQDSTVLAETSYQYHVIARDAAGNESASSNTANVTTAAAPDVTPPSAPGSLTATDVGHDQVTLGWAASADDVGVVGYDVYRDGGLLASIGAVTTYQDSSVVAETNYDYEVRALDAAGNVSGPSNAVNVTTLAAPDVTPPSAPASLTATDVGHDQVTLGWAVSTDDVGVVGYDVYRDGSLLVSIGAVTTYQDSTVLAETSYQYHVIARDAAGNASASSNLINVTTAAAPDVTAPSAPGSLTATDVGHDQVTLGWAASTDDVGVVGYDVYRDGSLLASTGVVMTYQDSTVLAETSYQYHVIARDAAGNESASSNLVNVTTAAAPDVTAPSVPGSLTATDVGHDQVTLGWTASTDDIGVVGYDVYRDGSLLASIGAVMTYQDSTVVAETNYDYEVRALDAAGNVSGPSNLVNVTTAAAPDVTPPSAPGSLTATDVQHNQVTLGWTASSDDVGVVGYDVYRDGSLLASTGVVTTYQDSTVVAETTYQYEARALDAAGNESASSNTLDVTTPAASLVLTFTPTDDATIREGRSNNNYGANPELEIDGQPVKDALLRFDVSGIGSGTVTTATLRLFVTNGSSFGGEFFIASDTTWNESTVTWGTAPAGDGGSLGSPGNVAAGSWYELNVTQVVTGDGPLSIRIGNSTVANGADYASKENANGNAPELVVNLGDAPVPDETPPSAPGSLTATDLQNNQVTLDWAASTDNIGVVGYDVYRDGGLLASIGAVTTHQDNTVAPNTFYQYEVRARDAAGNESGPSNTLDVTTPPPDVTPPSAPGSLTASDVQYSQVTLGWAASTDDVGVVGYDVYRDGGLLASIGAVTTYQDSTVVAESSYQYHVIARDAAGNASAPSNILDVTTPAAPLVLTFTPTDDATIREGRSNNNYGANPELELDGQPVKDALLRFDVSGVGTGTVTTATLRLFVTNGSSFGGEFFIASDTTWNESTVTWGTAPAGDGGSLGTLSNVAAGSWYELVVTPLVTGDGAVAIRIGNSAVANGAAYASKENANGNAPELVILLE